MKKEKGEKEKTRNMIQETRSEVGIRERVEGWRKGRRKIKREKNIEKVRKSV